MWASTQVVRHFLGKLVENFPCVNLSGKSEFKVCTSSDILLWLLAGSLRGCWVCFTMFYARCPCDSFSG